MPPPGWATGDIETEYLRLQREWQAERFLYDRDAAMAGGRRAEAGGRRGEISQSREFRDHAADPVGPVSERLLVQRDPQRDSAAADGGRSRGRGTDRAPRPPERARRLDLLGRDRRRSSPTARGRRPAISSAWRAAARCPRSPVSRWCRRTRRIRCGATISARTARGATWPRGCSMVSASRSSSRSSSSSSGR